MTASFMFVVYKYSSLLVYICHSLESHGAQMKLNNIRNGMNRHRSEKKVKTVFSSTNGLSKRYSPQRNTLGMDVCMCIQRLNTSFHLLHLLLKLMDACTLSNYKQYKDFYFKF